VIDSIVFVVSVLGFVTDYALWSVRAGGARDPRAGAVRGDELPDGQARRRTPGAVKIFSSSSSSQFYYFSSLCVHHDSTAHVRSLELAINNHLMDQG
jgi:hypothetical protein